MAGIAGAFIRRSCELCPYPWVETLTELGHISPLFERAGFVKVPTPPRKRGDLAGHSAVYGSPTGRPGRKVKRSVSAETHRKSRFADPIYYIFDNRGDKVAKR